MLFFSKPPRSVPVIQNFSASSLTTKIKFRLITNYGVTCVLPRSQMSKLSVSPLPASACSFLLFIMFNLLFNCRMFVNWLRVSVENVFTILCGLPWWLRGKESTCNAGEAAGTTGWIPGSGRPPGGESHWPPTPVFLPGKLHRQRSLAGYSPWGLQNCQT